MLILAFDCSGPACSVALWRDGEVLATERELMERGQAEALMPMIDRIMKAAGVGYGDLARIAVTVGPGSFTGVRAGLAAARGLSLAADVPAVGILTTAALAAAVPAHEREGAEVLAAIDTKRGDFYVQRFAPDGTARNDPAAMDADALRDWVGDLSVVAVGDGAATAAQAIGKSARAASTPALVDMGVLATLGAQATPQAGGPIPVYVHPPAITMPAS